MELTAAEYVNPRAKSCKECVKAKAKCYKHADGDNVGKCERCHRLSRECLMQTPVARARKRRQVQGAKIAEIEKRLNGFLSCLPPSIEESNPIFTPESINTSRRSSSTRQTFPNQQTGIAEETDDTLPSPLLSLRHDGVGFESTSSILDSPHKNVEPDELLGLFSQKLARQVPFISIPAHMSALTLSHTKPFLYQAIIASASYHDPVHQITLGQQFVKNLTEHLVLQGQKNLDMLQGLLVYISWYNCLFDAPTQLTTLLGFAFTLAIDLHLYLPMANSANHEKFLDEMKGIVSCNHATWFRRVEPSREEKRTILGCFYLFACVSMVFCRYNPLQWTPYIQHCHDDISSAPENENDIFLAQLSALQCISENIRHSGLRNFPSQPQTWNAATGVHFKLLLSELRKFRVSLPENLQQDSIILMHYHAIEMYLFEIGFSMPPTTPANMSTFQRADILEMCHKSTRAFSDIFFSIDIDSVPFINFSPIFKSQIYSVMTILSKLSLFNAEDWDASNVQTTLDLSTVLDRATAMTEAASAKYDVRKHNKPWLNITQRMRQVKVRFERLLANENRLSAAVIPGIQGQGDSINIMPSFSSEFDLLDDRFWQSLQDGDTFVN